jgi:predicted hotdog family 3-hydroxylacyl-ACP dehydratase
MWEIDHLVPHRHPMSLLHRVIEDGDDYLVAEADITAANPFFKADSGVPAWIGMEYMAQAVSALAGTRARRAGQPLLLGLLIGCRKYRTELPLFREGSRIRIEVREITSDGEGLGAFDCTITDCSSTDNGGESLVIASSQLTVYGRPREEFTRQ